MSSSSSRTEERKERANGASPLTSDKAAAATAEKDGNGVAAAAFNDEFVWCGLLLAGVFKGRPGWDGAVVCA